MGSEQDNNKDVIDYFRSNIFEALAAYSAWKMIVHSRSVGVVAEEMANRYVEIQNYHAGFFTTAEHAFLVTFVVKSLHSFDRRSDSFSLYKINKEKVEQFVKDNESVLDVLFALRNKLYAHRDYDAGARKFIVPATNNLDSFFENLISLYNNLSMAVDQSSTVFDNAKEIKRDIELLFMNLYRGEKIRKAEIDIEWQWEKDSKKASDIL